MQKQRRARYKRYGVVVCCDMKAKDIFKAMVGHRIMRHRQHKRFLQNVALQARQFGPGRGLMVLGALALGGWLMQRRKHGNMTQLSDGHQAF